MIEEVEYVLMQIALVCLRKHSNANFISASITVGFLKNVMGQIIKYMYSN
jgi:hypothetical protein